MNTNEPPKLTKPPMTKPPKAASDKSAGMSGLKMPKMPRVHQKKAGHKSSDEWEKISEENQERLSQPENLTKANALSEELHVSIDALVVARTGLNADGDFTFEMLDAQGKVIGLNRRSPNGEKKHQFGSAMGVFVLNINEDHPRGNDGYAPGPDNWVQIQSAGLLCPICSKPDWCMVSSENPSDPKAVICSRIKEGAAKVIPESGYLHIRKAAGNVHRPSGSLLRSSPHPVLSFEGASDCMAGYDKGFVTLGRPNNSAGLDIVAEVLRERDVVIFAENDERENPTTKKKEWPGRDGAWKAFAAVRVSVKRVRVVFPPPQYKDFRKWMNEADPTQAEILDWIEANAISELPDDIKDPYEGKGVKAPSKLSMAREILQSVEIELFHDGDTAYLTGPVMSEDAAGRRQLRLDRRITLAIESAGEYLSFVLRYVADLEVKKQDIDEIKYALTSDAKYLSPRIPVGSRWAWVGDGDDRILYYLMDPRENRVAKITAAGVVEQDHLPAEVRFIVPNDMDAYPPLAETGDLLLFTKMLSLDDEETRILVFAYMIGALIPSERGRPILSVEAEQDSGKSVLTKFIATALNYGVPETRLKSLPSTMEDLFRQARFQPVLAYDNGDTITPKMSNALCMMTTGGGVENRLLFTNGESFVMDKSRPVILNGIGRSVERPDLSDRCIYVSPPTLEPSQRKSEEDLFAEFKSILPQFMRGLFNAVSTALKNYKTVELREKPRLLDFCKWVVAAEPALPWSPGAFLRAYLKNRNEAREFAVEASPISAGLLAMLSANGRFEGTTSDLLAAVDMATKNPAIRSSFLFPRTPTAMGMALTRIAPALKVYGWQTEKGKTNGVRVVRITKMDPPRRSGPPVYRPRKK